MKCSAASSFLRFFLLPPPARISSEWTRRAVFEWMKKVSRNGPVGKVKENTYSVLSVDKHTGTGGGQWKAGSLSLIVEMRNDWIRQNINKLKIKIESREAALNDCEGGWGRGRNCKFTIYGLDWIGRHPSRVGLPQKRKKWFASSRTRNFQTFFSSSRLPFSSADAVFPLGKRNPLELGQLIRLSDDYFIERGLR